MSKSQKSNKEEKKKPLLTQKEKRAAKELKRHLRDMPAPFLPPAAPAH